MRRAHASECKAATVSPDELRAAGLSTDVDWLVREVVLAHAKIDRDYERFAPDLLDQFAATLPGKPLLVGHSRDGVPEGTWVTARTEGEGADKQLMARFAIPVLDDNAGLRQRVESGVARSVSIGFEAEARTCDVCGEDSWVCSHWPGRVLPDGTRATATWLPPGEAVEGSLVWLGAQPGAQVVRAAKAAHLRDADYCGGLAVYEASQDGEAILSWPLVALAAVSIAGRFGEGKALEGAAQAKAWADVMQCYALLGKHAPEWSVDEKFAWAPWREGEELLWHQREAAAEAKHICSLLDGRLKGAIERVAEKGGILPPDAVDALRAAAKALAEFTPPEATPVADAPEEVEDDDEADVAEEPDEEPEPVDPQQALLAALAAYVPVPALPDGNAHLLARLARAGIGGN
jgi:hypothetical protein